MESNSVPSWLVFLSVSSLAVALAFGVLIEVQVMNLQRSVESSLDELTTEVNRQGKVKTANQNSATREVDEDKTKPAGTALLVVDEMALETYKNTGLNYQLSIPTDTVARQTSDDVVFTGDMDFDVRRSGSGSDTKINFYLDNEVSGSAMVDGNSANISKSATGYCDGPGCSEPFIAYSMLKNGYNYTIVFYGDIQLSDYESQILNSFQFLN